MPLIVLLLVGLLFYFGPGVPALIGLALLGGNLLLVSLMSAVIFHFFGYPKGRT
jgi:hypothetical protein